MKLKITHDKKAKAVYIYLSQAFPDVVMPVDHSERLDQDTVLDFDVAGFPVGIEMLEVDSIEIENIS